MGTPEFAVAPLRKLIENQFKIAAVVTVPDKPAGRGLKLQESPVKQFANEYKIPVLQPVKLNEPEFIESLKQYKASLFIVVAFRKLPEAVWSLPPLGCFNLHASILPQYRGAAPINHAVMNGEKTTGVTTFFINDRIDTGKIIMQREIPVGPDETAGEVHDRLMASGADLVVETAEAIFTGNFTEKDQAVMQEKTGQDGLNESELKKAPKIFRDDCMINWQQSALSIHNFIRGLSPYPGAFGMLATPEGNKEIKVLKSALTNIPSKETPGRIFLFKKQFFVSTTDNLIELLILKPAGKKTMSAEEYIRGNRLELSAFIG